MPSVWLQAGEQQAYLLEEPSSAPEGAATLPSGSVPAAESTAATLLPATVTAPPAPLLADTYANREQKHRQSEQKGELMARYVTNDGSPESSKLLIGLKNVFTKCLPNMPKQYITRLVFDRNHRSTIIVRRNGQNGTQVGDETEPCMHAGRQAGWVGGWIGGVLS
jgi:hypothetical protein